MTFEEAPFGSSIPNFSEFLSIQSTNWFLANTEAAATATSSSAFVLCSNSIFLPLLPKDDSSTEDFAN